MLSERFRSVASLLLTCAVALATGCVSSAPPHTAAPVPAAELKPLDWRDAVLYFVVVDRFANGDLTNDQDADLGAKGTFHGGDLKGLREHLDEIAGLGVNALWITPVVRNIPGFVTGAGFPDWGYHGYWADDFYALDPRFGSEAELKALVDAAHRRGIRVLLDVVYNHVGYNSHYLNDPKTRTWIRSSETGGCGATDLTTCVAGLPDLKTELPEVAQYLFDAYLPLAKRTGLDGFRLDTVKHVDHPFWLEHRRLTHEQLGPNFFLLGEVWGGDAQVLDPWFVSDEMDAGFDFGFQGSVVAFVQGRGRTVAFDRYLKSREKVREGHHLAHFLSSHDVKGAYAMLDYDRELFSLAVVLQMTTAGIPTIYYGEEVGRRGGDWPDNRSDMPWGNLGVPPGAGVARDEALRSFYQRLISIRKTHPALSRGIHQAISTDGDLYVFKRSDASSGDEVVVAVNRGAEPAMVKFPLPEQWSADALHEELSGASVTVVDGVVTTSLPAKRAVIISGRRVQ